MNDALNLEIGLRLLPNAKNISDKIASCTVYGINHIQLKIDNYELLRKTNVHLFEQFETSVYLDFTPTQEMISLIIAEIINKKIKFLIIPLSNYNQLDTKKLRKAAEENHFFLCIDFNINELIDEIVEPVEMQKKTEKLHFFLITVTTEIPEYHKFEQLVKKYRTKIGIVHIKLSNNLITDKNSMAELKIILESLIFLPFDQQPIILSGDDNLLTLILQSLFGQR